MTELRSPFDVLNFATHELPVVRIVVAAVEGSAPREVGASMLVYSGGRPAGTIGGGQLEFQAIARARRMLEICHEGHEPWPRELVTWPLGPNIGQCCGGVVRVLFELYDQSALSELADLEVGTVASGLLIHPIACGKPVQVCLKRQDARALQLAVAGPVNDMLCGARQRQSILLGHAGTDQATFVEPIARPRQPLFIYGAGHVGRAIVKVISGLDFDVHWVDTHDERFPAEPDSSVTKVVAREPAIIAKAAPAGAFHLVLTYSHALDLGICDVLLERAEFGFLGLIGSATKRARFESRLRAAGVTDDNLQRLTCPIGIGELRGKEPATIAVSVAAQLIERLECARAANGTQSEAEHGRR